MNSVAVQQKRFAKFAPSNNSTTGYSPNGSQPIIRFSIADTKATADMKNARLNFRLRVLRAANTEVAVADDVNIDRRVMASGVIDQVIVSSRRYGNQLESVHNYGRLNSAWYDSNYSPKQMWCNQNLQTRSIGIGKADCFHSTGENVATLTNMGDQWARKQLFLNGNAGAQPPSSKDASMIDCSIPLHLGMFQSDDINLDAVGGLEIAIFLTRESFLLNGSGNNPPTAASSYQLHDVSLSVPLLYYSAAEIAAQNAQPEKAITFMNWTSIYSVLDSTFTSIAHRLNLNNLLSSIHNTQPTASINTFANNNFALRDSGIEQLTFLKDGVKNPLEKTTIVDTPANQNINQRGTKQVEVLTEALGAYKNPIDVLYSQVTGENVTGPAAIAQGHHQLGVNYDPSGGVGINVAGTISYDIQTKLQQLANATLTEPYAFYSFYLSKQGYLINQNGMIPI